MAECISVVEKHGWTPAHLCAIKGHKDCLQLLIENGADMTTRDHRGKKDHLAQTNICISIMCMQAFSSGKFCDQYCILLVYGISTHLYDVTRLNCFIEDNKRIFMSYRVWNCCIHWKFYVLGMLIDSTIETTPCCSS